MRINNYPFFLWLTQKREDFKLDLTNQKIVSNELGESSIKKVPLFLVLLMKYLPMVILLPFFYYPKSLFELFLFGGVLIVTTALFLIFQYQLIFKAVLLGF